MNTDWELVKAKLIEVVNENVKYLSEAMEVEEAISDLIEKQKRT